MEGISLLRCYQQLEGSQSSNDRYMGTDQLRAALGGKDMRKLLLSLHYQACTCSQLKSKGEMYALLHFRYSGWGRHLLRLAMEK